MATPKVLLKRSSVAGRIPDSSDLSYGELAINFADGKLYYKDDANNVKAFIDSARVQAIADAVEVVASAQLDSGETTTLVTSLIDSNYVQSRTNEAYLATIIDSGYVQLRVPLSYLEGLIDSAYIQARQINQDFAYSSLTGAPNVLDSTNVTNIIDSAYVAARVGDLGIDSASVNVIINDTVNAGYVQARQDFAYGSLTGTPTTVSTFTNDAGYLTNTTATTLVDSAYVRARVRTDQDLRTTDNVTFNQLRGPANFIIDPAAVGDNTGTVQILGNLQVEGTQTTINSTTVSINDKNIVLADSASNAAAADGAGITINGANATLQYAATGDKFVFNKPFEGEYLGFDSDFNAKSTTNLSEGSNLYYTKARADSDIAASLNDSTNSVSITINNTIVDAVDSAYVLARIEEAPFLDSYYTTELIDSDYVAARTTAGTDSAAIIQLIDSAYIAARTSSNTSVDSVGGLSLLTNVEIGDHAYAYNALSNHAGDVYYATALAASAVVADGQLTPASGSAPTAPYLYLSGTNRVTYSMSANISNPNGAEVTGISISFTGTGVSESSLNAKFPVGGSVSLGIYRTGLVCTLPDVNGTDESRSGVDCVVVFEPTSTFSGTTGTFKITGFIPAAGGGSVVDAAGNSRNLIGNFYDYTRLLSRSSESYIFTTTGNNGTYEIASTSSKPVQWSKLSRLDSDATIQLIDSAYIAARTSAGTDSATVISLINSTVHDSDVAINLNNLVELGLGKNVTQNTYTSVNATVTGSRYNDGSTSGTNTAHPYLQVSSLTNFLSGMDSGGAIWVSSDGVNFTNPSSVTWTGGYITSVNGKSNLIQLSTNVNFWDYSGQTVYSGADVIRRSLRLQGDSSSSKIIASKNLSIEGDNGATITVAGYNIKDSSAVTSIIDSDYIRLHTRIGDSDINFGSHKILYSNVYSTEGDLPSASTYHGMFAHVHGTGAGYFAHAGAWTRLANQSEIFDGAYGSLTGTPALIDSSLTTQLIDSAYIQARQTSGGGGGTGTVDSAYVLSIIDSTNSPFLQTFFHYTATAGQTTFTGNDDASNTLSYTADAIAVYLNGILLVDTQDYTASNGTSVVLTVAASLNDIITIQKFSGSVIGGGGGTVDSADIIAIVDSDYVQARQLGGNLSPLGAYTQTSYRYISTTGQTIITGNDENGNSLNYRTDQIDVFLNGILLFDSADYTQTNNTTLTMTSALDSADDLNIIWRRGQLVRPNVKVYEYTATASQSTFSGADLSNETLSYVAGAVQIFVNGILLKSSTDYTATNGTSVLLTSPAGAGDDIAIAAYAAPAAKATSFTFTADSAQAVFSGVDNKNNNFSYEVNNSLVFLNGIVLNDSDDFTASNGTSVTLTTAANLNDELKVVSFGAITTTQSSNNWSETTTSIKISPNEKKFVDCSNSAIMLEIQDSNNNVSMGDELRIIDGYGNAANNNITLRSTKKIIGSDSDLIIDINRSGTNLVYYNESNGWVLIEN